MFFYNIVIHKIQIISAVSNIKAYILFTMCHLHCWTHHCSCCATMITLYSVNLVPYVWMAIKKIYWIDIRWEAYLQSTFNILQLHMDGSFNVSMILELKSRMKLELHCVHAKKNKKLDSRTNLGTYKWKHMKSSLT